jgi:hypothetical protein
MHPEIVIKGLNLELWALLQDKPEPLYTRVNNEDLLLDVINIHAWSMGIMRLKDTVLAVWDKIEPLSRASFLAAMTELGGTDPFRDKAELFSKTSFLERGEASPYFNMLVSFDGHLEYSLDTFCQLACNAIHSDRIDILKHLLTQPVDLTASVRRFSASRSYDNWEQKEIEKLSHRIIDMILEAALIENNLDMARLALQHGADPNIPIWQLERSYNHKYSALGYVIDMEFPYRGMIDLLLDQGASAAGTPYGGYNHELFLALGKGRYELVDRLISLGAGLSKPAKSADNSEVTKTAGCEHMVIGPGGPNFFGHFGDRLKWAHENIGSIIPLVPVSEKQAFFSSHAQGGSYSTIMERVIGNLDRLKRYEALGLDTRLSAEELCSAVGCGAFDSLVYLISKHGDSARDRAMFRIRRRKPDIGAAWHHMDMVPQADGINSADEFDPQDQKPFELPDGSKLYVDLSAIAAPGHKLGPCFEGHFWLRKDTAILRRRKDRVIVRRFEHSWHMEPFPLRPPGTCREQRYLDECIPCIRETGGQYIYLGLSLQRVRQIVSGCTLGTTSTPWKDLPPYVEILDQAEQRIKAQDSCNSRPGSTPLTDYELWGYPPEFWLYLVRLENGFISMTIDSCQGKTELLKEYKAWAKKAKIREIKFAPDQQLLEWEHWSEVPVEYKPYYYWDTMFGDRPSVTMGSYDNKYESTMASKVRNWYDNKREEWFQAKKARQE